MLLSASVSHIDGKVANVIIHLACIAPEVLAWARCIVFPSRFPLGEYQVCSEDGEYLDQVLDRGRLVKLKALDNCLRDGLANRVGLLRVLVIFVDCLCYADLMRRRSERLLQTFCYFRLKLVYHVLVNDL